MPFLGMRGTGDWGENQRPESWRETILYLYPNGSAPLTALLSMMDSEQVDDPKFHWWTQTLPSQGGSVTSIHTASSLDSPYAGGGSQGDTLYVEADSDVINQMKIGHVVALRVENDFLSHVTAKVTARDPDSNYVQVRLNSDVRADHDIDDGDRVIVVTGSMHAEGVEIPEAINYDPVQHTNVTEIFRNSLSITRTARLTRYRTGDAYSRLKRDTLELHSIEMEKGFMFNQMYEGVGDNGKPERAMMGLIPAIFEYEPENVFDYRTDDNAIWNGDAFIDGGEEWINHSLERIFRYGHNEKLGLCGNGVLLQLQRVARAGGQLNLEVNQTDYGIRVVEWTTPFGTLYLKNHPLMSRNLSMNNDMVILEPDKIRYKYITDTMFKEDNSEWNNTNNSKDSTDEEYLTEASLEYHHTPAFGYMGGFGQVNTNA